MIVLALLEIEEPTACDLAIELASAGVPVRRRTRRVTERVLAERHDAVRVRWATVARQDREEFARRHAR